MTLDELEQDLASMLDPLDIPRSWTQRELDNYEARRSVLRARISTIRAAMATLHEVTPQLTELTKWKNHLTEWRTTLTAQLDEQPATPRTTQELAMREKLRYSLQRINTGLRFDGESTCVYASLPLDDLLREAGYVPRDAVARAEGDAWFGSLNYVEPKLKELLERHDDAQYRLKRALEEELTATA